jgi:hypothetical protein
MNYISKGNSLPTFRKFAVYNWLTGTGMQFTARIKTKGNVFRSWNKMIVREKCLNSPAYLLFIPYSQVEVKVPCA